MKHFQSLAAVAATLLTVSCSVKEDRIQCLAPVTVAVNTISLETAAAADVSFSAETSFLPDLKINF